MYFKVWMALVNRLFIINQGSWISVKQSNNAITPLTMRSHNENNSMQALAYSFKIYHRNQVENTLNFCKIQILHILRTLIFWRE